MVSRTQLEQNLMISTIFRTIYWPLLFDNFWGKIGKNTSKKWVNKFFFEKNPATQNFEKYAQNRRDFGRLKCWGVVTLGFRNSSETRVRIFLAIFCVLCNFWSNFAKLFTIKNVVWVRISYHRKFLEVRQKFLTPKIIFFTFFL